MKSPKTSDIGLDKKLRGACACTLLVLHLLIFHNAKKEKACRSKNPVILQSVTK